MRFATICLTLAIVVLAACGGSSDNSSNVGNPPPPASLAIDGNNAVQVAGAAYGAAASSSEFGEFSDSAGIMAAGGGLAKTTVNGQVKAAIDGAAQQIPFGSGPTDCLVDGSIDVSGDITDPVAAATGVLSPGDTFRVEYIACDDGAGEVLDGRIDMIVGDPFTGNFIDGAYELTMNIEITSFQVRTDADVVTTNGDASSTLNTLAAPYVEASVSGDSITIDTDTSSETLTAYSSLQTFDGSVTPAPYTMAAAGTLDSTEIGGIVDYSTPDTFEGVDSGYPTVGILLVEGAGSAARLIAQANGIDVIIEIDANGDGTFEESMHTTWEALASY